MEDPNDSQNRRRVGSLSGYSRTKVLGRAMLTLGILTLIAVLGGGPAEESAVSDDFPLLNLLSVCPDPQQVTVWVVVWHPEAPGVEPLVAERLFRRLQGHDFDACLASIIEADPEASALASTLGQEGVKYSPIQRAVYRAWRQAGVYQALKEVARLGRRGPAVGRLLDGCRPTSSQTAPTEGGN